MRNNDIRTILKDRRTELGYTMKKVAEHVGVSEATISRWESGNIANMRRDRIALLAEVLQISPAVIMGWTDESTVGDDACAIHSLTNNGRIPVFGRIPAGVPIDAVQDVSGYIDVPSAWVDDHGALIVKGDSMEPKYFDGDTVIFRVQPDCESGQDCIVYVNGYDATLKKVVKTETGIILQPLNPEYDPLICGSDNPATILGVVVELRRKV